MRKLNELEHKQGRKVHDRNDSVRLLARSRRRVSRRAPVARSSVRDKCAIASVHIYETPPSSRELSQLRAIA